MIEIQCNDKGSDAKIIVIGVGGGGNNAIERMISAGIDGVSFAAINTDSAVLDHSSAEHVLKIGDKLLSGYGAGADPDKGEAAAIESEDKIKELISGYNMAIITCGMGGGTGTGAAPVVAKCCKDAGLLTLAVVTKPFSFESRPRMIAAEIGVDKLKNNVDTLLVIPNDKLLAITDRQLRLSDAFVLADSVLKYSIEGITNIVYHLGEINIDFNDLRTILTDKGIGHLGIGTTDTDGSVLEAVKQAVNSPLLETTIEGAQSLMINTSGNITLMALNEAMNYIREIAGESVNIIWGTVSGDETENNKIVVTIIATGMPDTINGKDDKASSSKSIPVTMPISFSGSQKNRSASANTSRTADTVQSSVEEYIMEIPYFLKNADKKSKAVK